MKRFVCLSAVAVLAGAGCPKSTPQEVIPPPQAPTQPAATEQQEQQQQQEQQWQEQQEPREDEAAKLPYIDPGAESPESINRAVALLMPAQGSNVRGVVRFEQQADGVSVTTEIEGLPSGAQAYHIHVYGDCTSDDAESAGTHFNFEGSSLDPPDDIQRITGNLGDLVPGEDGKATGETMLPTATLHGPYSIVGRSVVVHEQRNDPSQPPIGGAGGRIACGVIGIDE